jgi:tRNA-(ms[2]io[6]A)-hydroxylase
VERSVLRIRAVEQELIESPDAEFRFHSGCPAAMEAGRDGRVT